jgi:hypothetical protein
MQREKKTASDAKATELSEEELDDVHAAGKGPSPTDIKKFTSKTLIASRSHEVGSFSRN